MPQISLGRATGRAHDRPELSPEYRAYLRSERWQELRLLVLLRDNHACTQCGRTDNLEIHHRTYERLGCETLSDLITLCRDCHRDADKGRQAQTKEDRRRRRATARRQHVN
jgi:5-methylcytosine-specific restriction endonuclease McrA